MLEPKAELSDVLQVKVETCKNPWNGVCENMDIVLYIFRKNEKVPICRECWREIASKDFEWRFN